MSEHESQRATHEAQREMRSGERPGKHEDEVRRYLGGALYLAEKGHHEEQAEEVEKERRREQGTSAGR